jgi:hypothetical protein
MSKHIHIGKKIKEVLVQSRIGKTEFASMINVSRTVVYDIFKRETIDTAQLQIIGKALKHDFFTYYKSSDTPVINENKGNYGYATKEELSELTHTVQTLVKEIEKLREEVVSKKNPSKKSAKGKK